MKHSLVFLSLVFCLACYALSAPPVLPDGYPIGQYDEDKVPQFTLPDPLTLQNGQKVTDANTWQKQRRPEIIKLFEENVYGKTMVGRPKDMTFKLTKADPNAMNGKAVAKDITIYFTGKETDPNMKLKVLLPKSQTPVPAFVVIGWGPTEIIINRGYGLIVYNPWDVDLDKPNSYDKSIRKFFAKHGRNQPEPNEWGAIGSWAWAASRAMDYIETDPDIDESKIALFGFSRYGKTAMWAGAQDERFALIISGQAGCGGANLVRRRYGETIASITGWASYWFCPNFKKFANRENDLPVDWHMLFALMAPRPVFVHSAKYDYWCDPKGTFLAAKHAEDVYNLFGKKGLGDIDMPPVKTLVGDTVVYYLRDGGHGADNSDWKQFLDFADKNFDGTKVIN
ncbi:MAG: acetylxylan esterase [Phycisphaerae bacterium]